tara:strand:+ start:1831 stop:2151 length:321 start_codon:yes stop_codon:yes gene_type:complete
MGLEARLTKGTGSPLSKANGADIPIPVGATKQSDLQFNYSINGIPDIPMKGYFTNYQSKPKPSILDLNNGLNPVSANRDGNTPSINNTFKNGTYKNSAPAEGIGRI